MSNIQNNSEDNLQYYVNEAKGNLDLSSYNKWVKWGMAFASLGEEGKEPFRILSEASENYDPIVFDTKFDSWVKDHNGNININSFYYYCIHQLDILPNPNYNGESKKIHNSKGTAEASIHLKPEELKSFTLKDIQNSKEEPRIWKFIMSGTLNGIASSSDTGKSTLLRNLTKAIVTRDTHFLGWELDSRKARVIYVSTEDGMSQQKLGFNNILSFNDINEDSIQFIFDSANIIKNILRLLQDNVYSLIIIDTWGDLVGGDYDSMKARKVLQELGDICTRYTLTVLLVHHTNKASDNIPHKNSIKGTGDFEQKLRCIMMLSTHQGGVWLSVVKGNDLTREEKELSYKLGYDEEKREVFMTNETDYVGNLIQEARRDIHTTNKVEVEWESIMEGGPHRYSRIVESLKVLGLSEIGAKRKIKKAVEYAFIEKNENNLYVLCS